MAATPQMIVVTAAAAFVSVTLASLAAIRRVLTVDPVWDRYICSRTPAGRWGDPRELIGTAVVLASKASNYMNGQIVTVDGGLLAAL